MDVEVDAQCEVTLEASVDPADVPGKWLGRETRTPGESEAAVDGTMHWETLGGLATCGLAYVTELLGIETSERTCAEWGEQRPLQTEYRFRLQPGQRVRLRQITSLVPSQLHHRPDEEARRLVAFARTLGFDTLRAENRSAWEQLWQGRVLLHGADRHWQALSDAAFYYLNASVHPSSPSSTSIFGLAQWYDYHYYYGHVMWDVETFSVGPLLLVQPEAALEMLEYRFRVLPAARLNAKLNGRRGIQFPWESGMALGEESSPGPGSGAWYEDHVTLDVAFAFAQYAHVAGDQWFRRERAWPVLQGVAEWLLSRVVATDRGYEIQRMMGIAERSEPSNNDAFTAMAARVVLREAIACASAVGYPAPLEWSELAERLVVPIDPGTSVIRAHDDYRPEEEKGATPGPLVGLFPYWHTVDQAVERETLRFYLDLAPQYLGSPMLSSLYGVWAAWLGDRERSLALFEEGYARFVQDRFFQTYEYRPDRFPEQPRAGPFFANLSGFLLGLLYGLPGLRPGAGHPEGWPSRPVVLPAGWDSIEVQRIWIRGRPARLLARHGGERAELEMLDG
ncbi:MAG: glycoside hydrolase family 65 protein [Chloroflexi bacterium]|nr:glycoside hydrolase family 65 protein [Chloroflexota bacterium]